MATATGLAVALEVREPVVAGLAALATLRVINRGNEPRLVSARLNLMEGDLRLFVTAPDGSRREVRGWQADTGLHRVELQPGQQLVGAINLLEAEDGPVFAAPGQYRLEAEYCPGPQAEPVTSGDVPVTVSAPGAEAEAALAKLLADPAARRALVLADPEGAPEALSRVASEFPDRLEGRLARLILSGGESSDQAMDWSAVEGEAGSVPLALSILALTNPYGRTGERLADEYAAHREASRPAGDAGEAPGPDEALQMVRMQPLPADAAAAPA
jgi:hypothetical protein